MTAKKRVLGLDLGANSIGWALVEQDWENKEGRIIDAGSRIIPMDQNILGQFDSGQSVSQTADRTHYRGVRRLYQRNKLRRERLHRVLNILNFLPSHYKNSIDFVDKLGQFKPDMEVKINYKLNEDNDYEFVFKDSFNEMLEDFKIKQPQLFYKKKNGEETLIPYDWTIYYLRQKALRQPITKEELAWVILNFNQKRGYYQLRGEDDEKEDKSKLEEFYQLKVKQVEETEDSNSKGTWYNVILENDWVYRRQSKEPLDSWLGQQKEFIITTQLEKDGSLKLDKEGKVKRSFRAVDSEKDWPAIKAKTEQDIAKSKKTVGEYIYDTLLANPTQKVRGSLIKTIERKYYKEEFEEILSKQIELSSDLFSKEQYQLCIQDLYPNNEAHRKSIQDKDFKYLLTEDIIFYQRPLKSQKSNIAGCQFEFREYSKLNSKTGQKEKVKEAVKAISKSHPLYQEFRIWQWLHNLKIYNEDQVNEGKFLDLTTQLLSTDEEYTDLFNYLNSKIEVEEKHLIDYFIKKDKIAKKDKNHIRWNYVEGKKYPLAETRNKFINRLKKVKGIENPEKFLTQKTQLGTKTTSPYARREEQLWQIVYSVTDPIEFKKALDKFAIRHDIDKDSFVENFIKIPAFKSDYGSLSKKALQKIVPLMRRGTYWQKDEISSEVKQRANDIMERVNNLNLKSDYSEKDLKNAISKISDDDIPKQLIKSFVSLKDKNPLEGLNTYQATYLVYGKHSEVGEIQIWKSPEDIDKYLTNFKQHLLRNPIVEQVVTETLRVVSDIWKYYGNGENGFFSEIHLELGRDMKNSADKRKRINQRNLDNENTNFRIRELLEEMTNDSTIKGDVRPYSSSHQEILKLYEEGVYQNPNADYKRLSEDEVEKIRKNKKPSKKEIQKYKLWLEQGYISPYTGQPIPLSKLFTHEYQIEHIIPQSRYFDNSMTNKVICESEVNEDKGNQTALEYIKNKKGSIVHGYKLMSLEKYEDHVKQYFKRNQPKLKNLLSEDIPEGFINRQLNDSRYISRFVKGVLSNIVRKEGEQEAISKNVIPISGAITHKLKHDWGLHDKWNDLIAPRFKRLNRLKKTDEFGYFDPEINAFRIQVPDEFSRGFSSKRIDHRHHALDALVIACTSREHVHYLNSLNSERENYALREKLLIKNKHGHFTKTFQLPWQSFPVEAKNALEEMIISFKQNLRVINKSNNKFWSYKDEKGKLNLDASGKPKKRLRKQTKGDNWAIRKSLHKETVSGLYDIPTPKGKIATSVRTSLSEIKNAKHVDKIADYQIREVIIPNHLKSYLNEKGEVKYDIAFSEEGIIELNKNIVQLNNGKPHQPVYKVKMFEIGSKFQVGETGNNPSKYVEAQKGTNLFFAIYWDADKEKRNFETIPLHEVIAHQKQVAHLPKEKRTPIQPKAENGEFLFTLSPNDLVYVPTDEELENPNLVDIDNLTIDQKKRIHKMVSCTGNQCFFIQSNVSKSIANKQEFSTLNKMERSIEDVMIKERCWKLKVDRLGNISKVIK